MKRTAIWKSKVSLVLGSVMLASLFTLVSCGKGESVQEKGGTASAPSKGRSSQMGAEKKQHWTCSMHPQVDEDGPGKCPYCGMDLIPVASGKGGVLTLTKEAAALAEVEVTKVKRRPLNASILVTGKVVEDETRVHSVTAWVSGRIDRLFVDFTGTRVSVGDHIAELYSPQMISAQEEYLEARKALSEMAASKSPLMLDTTRASVRAARDKLRLLGLDEMQIKEIETSGKAKDHITIRAPHGGIVTKKRVQLGTYVKTGQELYEVVDLTQVWVELLAFERDLPLLKFGQKVEVRVDAIPGKVFEGRISLLDPEIDPRTRTLPLRVVLENKDLRIRPGMFARASVKVPLDAEGNPRTKDFSNAWICPMHPEVVRKEKGNCPKCGMPLVKGSTLGLHGQGVLQDPLAVPESAVLFTGRRSIVWVALAGDKPQYMPREIILGPRGEGYYVVLSGLMEGERVVTEGAFKIDSEAQIKSRPSAPIPSMMSPGGLQKAKEPKTSKQASKIPNLKTVNSADLAKILKFYLRAQDLLAKSNKEAAREALTEGFVDVNAPAFEGLRKKLMEDKSDRGLLEVFRDLGTALFTRKEKLAGIQEKLVWAFCPMAFDGDGANWLQVGKKIQNPYYGTEMLSCGEVVETLVPGKSSPKKKQGNAGNRSKGKPRGKNKAKKERKPASRPAPKKVGTTKSPNPVQPKALTVAQILPAYLKIQKALSEDRIADAAKGLFALSKKDRKGVLVGISPEKGADSVRKCFNALGRYLLKHKAMLRGKAKGLVVAHCPMAFDGKGADWLQLGKEIRNPYYGSSMLACGSVVEDLSKPADKKGGGK